MDAKIARFLLGLRQARTRALMLDYDGTLAPFCPEPENARPYPEVPPLLQHIAQHTDTSLVIVSGRPVAGVKCLLDIPRIEIWGCHGLERLKSDGVLHRSPASAESIQALADVTDLLLNDGLAPFAERKFASIAIHWRGKEDLADDLTRRVMRAWSAVKDQNHLRILPFDGGIEIALAAKTKADAVRSVLSDIGSDAAVAYLGDDATDEDAFGALKGRGLNVLVRGEYRKTLADAWIRPPAELAAFLHGWIAAAGGS